MDDALKADLIALVLEQGRLTTTDTAVHREKTFSLPSDQPFFLACGIFRPHLPWIAPREFVNRFSADDIAIDREFFLRMVDDIRDLPPARRKKASRRRPSGSVSCCGRAPSVSRTGISGPGAR